MRRAAMLVLLGVGVVALSGCTRGQRDLESWVQEVKARPAPPLDPLPVMRQFDSFEYAAHGMRDPFSPPANEDGASGGPRPDPDRRKEVLEAFPLDALDMVGTIGSAGDLVGLVMGPDRVTYRVREGNYMGQSEGRITGIHEDRIELVELVSDGAGGWVERRAQVALEDN